MKTNCYTNIKNCYALSNIALRSVHDLQKFDCNYHVSVLALISPSMKKNPNILANSGCQLTWLSSRFKTPCMFNRQRLPKLQLTYSICIEQKTPDFKVTATENVYRYDCNVLIKMQCAYTYR